MTGDLQLLTDIATVPIVKVEKTFGDLGSTEKVDTFKVKFTDIFVFKSINVSFYQRIEVEVPFI